MIIKRVFNLMILQRNLISNSCDWPLEIYGVTLPS